MAGGSAKKITTENARSLRNYMIGNLVSGVIWTFQLIIWEGQEVSL